MCRPNQQGFTLVELITVLVIVGVLASVAASRMGPQATLQLQAGRDMVVSALFVAQQTAMAQSQPVRVIAGDGRIDIRVDRNGDGVFSANESLSFAGTFYPRNLPGNLQISVSSIDYNRLGHATPAQLTLSQGGASVNVTVSEAGYVY